jgi:hypothetical protein
MHAPDDELVDPDDVDAAPDPEVAPTPPMTFAGSPY